MYQLSRGKEKTLSRELEGSGSSNLSYRPRNLALTLVALNALLSLGLANG